MQDVFQSVVGYGEAAGWTEREVADARIELAHNRGFMLDSKEHMFEEAVGVVIHQARPALPLTNEMMATIHHRMPVILHPEAYSRWMS